MTPPNREHQILQDARATLQEIGDLKAKVLPLPTALSLEEVAKLIDAAGNLM
jgi:hypothetical protein